MIVTPTYLEIIQSSIETSLIEIFASSSRSTCRTQWHHFHGENHCPAPPLLRHQSSRHRSSKTNRLPARQATSRYRKPSATSNRTPITPIMLAQNVSIKRKNASYSQFHSIFYTSSLATAVYPLDIFDQVIYNR